MSDYQSIFSQGDDAQPPNANHRNRKLIILAVIIGMLAVGVWVIMIVLLNNLLPRRSATFAESPKEIAIRSVRLGFKASTEFGIMEANFLIQNPTNYTIKDIEVTCTHFANSGTQIDSNTRTIYELVPAGGKKIVRGFNMGFIHSQAKKTDCKVTDLEVIQ